VESRKAIMPFCSATSTHCPEAQKLALRHASSSTFVVWFMNMIYTTFLLLPSEGDTLDANRL
jgi:hypothetical protein